MTIFRTIELIGGIATGLLTVSYFVFLVPQGQLEFRREVFLSFLGWFVILGVPAALTLTGAYLHSVKHRSWGSVILGITTVVSMIYILLLFLGGVIGYMGLRYFLWAIAPSILTIFTGLIAFAVVRFEKSKQF